MDVSQRRVAGEASRTRRDPADLAAPTERIRIRRHGVDFGNVASFFVDKPIAKRPHMHSI